MDSKILEKQQCLIEYKEILNKKHGLIQEKMKNFERERRNIMKKRAEFEEQKLYNMQIITENKGRYERACEKLKEEIRIKERNKEEFLNTYKEIKELEKRKNKLMKKVKDLKKYGDFIKKAIDLLPNDYYSGGLDHERFINRHDSLYNSSYTLILSFVSNSYRMQHIFDQSYMFYLNQDKVLVLKNKDLSDLYMRKEMIKDKLKKVEIDMFNQKALLREKATLIGVTLRAFDNISNKCIQRKNELILRNPSDENISNMTITSKITLIKNFIFNIKGILQELQNTTELEV